MGSRVETRRCFQAMGQLHFNSYNLPPWSTAPPPTEERMLLLGRTSNATTSCQGSHHSSQRYFGIWLFWLFAVQNIERTA
jgi:hypothetical protein